MPKVPVYDNQTQVSGGALPRAPLSLARQPLRDPNVVGSSNQARGQLFEVQAQGADDMRRSLAIVGRVADEVGNTSLRIFDAVQQSRKIARSTEYKTSLANAIQEIQRDPNLSPEQYAQKYDELAIRLRDKHSEGLVGPWLAQFQAEAASAATHGKIKLTNLAWEDANSQLLATYQQARQQTEADWADLSPSERKAREQELNQNLDYLVKRRAISPAKAQTLRKNQSETLGVISVRALLDQDRVSEAEDEFKRIQPLLSSTTHYRLRSLIDRKRKAIKAQQKAARITSVYGSLVSKYDLTNRDGVEKATKLLMSPDFQRRNGLSVKDAYSLVTKAFGFYSHQKALDLEARQQMRDETLYAIGQAVAVGNPAEAMRIATEKKHVFHGEQFLSLMTSLAKAPPPASDQQAVSWLQRKELVGTLSPHDIAAVFDKLSPKDRTHFIAAAQKTAEQRKKKGLPKADYLRHYAEGLAMQQSAGKRVAATHYYTDLGLRVINSFNQQHPENPITSSDDIRIPDILNEYFKQNPPEKASWADTESTESSSDPAKYQITTFSPSGAWAPPTIDSIEGLRAVWPEDKLKEANDAIRRALDRRGIRRAISPGEIDQYLRLKYPELLDYDAFDQAKEKTFLDNVFDSLTAPFKLLAGNNNDSSQNE